MSAKHLIIGAALCAASFVGGFGSGQRAAVAATARATEVRVPAPVPASAAATAARPQPAPKPGVIIERRISEFQWVMIETNDYRAYVGNLRRIGCPEETVRDIVMGDVLKMCTAKKKELREAFQNAAAAANGEAVRQEALAKSRSVDLEAQSLVSELLGTRLQDEITRYNGFLGGLPQ